MGKDPDSRLGGLDLVKMKIKDAIKLINERERQTVTEYKFLPGVPPAHVERMISLWIEGYTYTQISKKTGYCYGTVARYVGPFKKSCNKGYRPNCIPQMRMVEA
jgi:DNA-directed RNA polymerase specialized sigma24 family protein